MQTPAALLSPERIKDLEANPSHGPLTPRTEAALFGHINAQAAILEAVATAVGHHGPLEKLPEAVQHLMRLPEEQRVGEAAANRELVVRTRSLERERAEVLREAGEPPDTSLLTLFRARRNALQQSQAALRDQMNRARHWEMRLEGILLAADDEESLCRTYWTAVKSPSVPEWNQTEDLARRCVRQGVVAVIRALTSKEHPVSRVRQMARMDLTALNSVLMFAHLRAAQESRAPSTWELAAAVRAHLTCEPQPGLSLRVLPELVIAQMLRDILHAHTGTTHAEVKGLLDEVHDALGLHSERPGPLAPPREQTLSRLYTYATQLASGASSVDQEHVRMLGEVLHSAGTLPPALPWGELPERVQQETVTQALAVATAERRRIGTRVLELLAGLVPMVRPGVLDLMLATPPGVEGVE